VNESKTESKIESETLFMPDHVVSEPQWPAQGALQKMAQQPLQRRELLRYLLAGSAAWATPALWGQVVQAPLAQGQAAQGQVAPAGRLVLVFLRGAYDGLSALVPYGDSSYYPLRPHIAIALPDGSAQSVVALDALFGLHPAMAALLPLWQQGVLAAIPCAGSPDPTRSHFDAQHHWEIGVPGLGGSGAGWLNTLAAMLPAGGLQRAAWQRETVQPDTVPHETVPHAVASARRPVAVGVGEANPFILAGPSPVQRVAQGQAATRQGVVADPKTRDALMRLYAGSDSLSQAFRAGADSRMQTAQTLMDHAQDPAMQTMQAANNGAGAAQGLWLDAQHLGTLMRQDRQLRIGFLSAGGWDTHANQGAYSGALAGNLANLARAMLQLRKDFSQPNDVVVVCSEFGRTSAENGTRGTDHGHGNTLWVMGNGVQGGRWHGRWSGLSKDQLHEGRDLPVHHDFRAIFAQILRSSQGLDMQAVGRLFPGFAWDHGIDGLMRA
jgi:uncharacterized protein (DUF1501 family)